MERKARPPRSTGNEFRNKVYSFIDGFWREKFFSPSVREISIGVEANSTSHVLGALLQLAEEGLIYRIPGGLSRCYIPNWIVVIIQGE